MHFDCNWNANVLFYRREKEEGEEAENEEDTIKNGFVPINQAVKNAEVSCFVFN